MANYYTVELQDNVEYWVCHECDSLVISTSGHNAWHDKLEKSISNEYD